MKAGDLVRFRRDIVERRKRGDCEIWEWNIGFLVEYKKWEKVATILYEGNLIRVRAMRRRVSDTQASRSTVNDDVQKAAYACSDRK